jgi:CheY-like chemotaxis protein
MISNILMIEDDSITQMLNKMVMKHTQFCDSVEVVSNGDMAIEYLENFILNGIKNSLKKPDLILLDLNMPVMDGWEFLEMYKQKYASHFPDTKILILSSTVNPKDEERASQDPFIIGFENKPLSYNSTNGLKELSFLAPFFN